MVSVESGPVLGFLLRSYTCQQQCRTTSGEGELTAPMTGQLEHYGVTPLLKHLSKPSLLGSGSRAADKGHVIPASGTRVEDTMSNYNIVFSLI